MTYIKFPSHRARDYAMRQLDDKPQAYYVSFDSPRRNLRHRGIYGVNDMQLATLKNCNCGHVRFTILRGPFDDLNMCWMER